MKLERNTSIEESPFIIRRKEIIRKKYIFTVDEIMNFLKQFDFIYPQEKFFAISTDEDTDLYKPKLIIIETETINPLDDEEYDGDAFQ